MVGRGWVGWWVGGYVGWWVERSGEGGPFWRKGTPYNAMGVHGWGQETRPRPTMMAV